MNNFTMGLPSNYINNPLYQQYAQLIANSAKMTQEMFTKQLQQQAAYQQQLLQQQAAQKAAEKEAIAAQQQSQEAAQAEQFAKAAEAKALSGAEDGCNDGKISFGSKIKNLGKGVVNFFKGMVCDENGKFSLKRTLTTVGIAAGATVLTIATGGAAAPFLVAAGATLGAVEIGKGAYKAVTANTDAEAEAAWQNIGSGTTAVVGSVIGAKSALKSAKVDVSAYKGIRGAIKATGQTFKYAYDSAKAGIEYVKINGLTNSVVSATKSMSANLKTGWKSAFKSTNAKENAKSQMEAKYDSRLQKNNTQTDNLMKEIASLEKDPVANAAKITQKKNELASLLHEKTVLEARKASIPENVRTVDNKARINDLNKDIAELRQELDFIKSTLPEADVSAMESELMAKVSIKNRLVAQQTTSGVRKLQLERLEANKVNLEAQIKTVTEKGLKDAYRQQLDNVNARIAEVKQFAQIENAQQSVAAAKTRLPKYQSALDKINKDIELVKNNTALTADQKATQLASLAKDQANAIKLVNAAKTKLSQGKRTLYWNNVKSYEAANRKSIGYPTVAITGGGVVTQSQYNPADVYAQAYGYNSAEEMQAALDAQNAQMGQALAATQAQNQQNSSIPSTSQTTTTNPYLTNNMFSGITPLVTNNLGFNELYVSPYSDYIA